MATQAVLAYLQRRRAPYPRQPSDSSECEIVLYSVLMRATTFLKGTFVVGVYMSSGNVSLKHFLS